MPFLLVFVGGAIGAPVRYLVDRFVQSRHQWVFPFGTLTVNLIGAVVLGGLTAAVVHHGLPHDLSLLLGTGLCGGLTTFSTFGYETVTLLEQGSLAEAGLNALGSLLAGLAAAAAAFAIVTAL